MWETLINQYAIQTLVVGLLSGMFIVWFVFRHKLNQLSEKHNLLERDLAVAQERAINKDQTIEELKEQLKDKDDINRDQQNEIEKKLAQIAELSTLLEEERRLSEEKLKLLEQAETKMSDAFENLSSKILEEKSKKFIEQNKENIGAVLTPLKEQLGDFRKRIEDVYDKETKDRLSLYHEITSLKSLNEKMSQDAVNLTNALKGESKKRGDWGEVILERVLEASGLKNGREYEVQASYRDDNNNLFRPDVVVHLPNNRDVIIDSKVSLNAYERYYSAEDEASRSLAIKEHIASIKTHINELKDKSYDELIGVNSLDMVLMFVPVEPALMLALDHDENLFQEAFSNRIFMVSPSTLTMNLQVIHNMWRYEYQNLNAMKIAKQAGDMYDKLTGFVEALEDVGDKLEKAQLAYDTAHNRLIDGRGNLISKAETIKKLGELKTNKQLPVELIGKASEQE